MLMVNSFNKRDEFERIDPYNIFQEAFIKDNEYIENETQRDYLQNM